MVILATTTGSNFDPETEATVCVMPVYRKIGIMRVAPG